MTLEDEIVKVLNILEKIYEENYDIRDEPQIQNLKKAMDYLRLML